MLIKAFFPIPRDIPTYDAQYSTYTFIYAFLALLAVTLSYYVFLNIFFTGYIKLAFIEFSALIAIAFIHRDLYLHQNIQRSAYLFTGLIVLLIGSLNLFIETNYFILIWNIFVPTTAFYLLGSRHGAILSSIYSLLFFYYLYGLHSSTLPIGLKENFTLAYLILSFALYIFENSRNNTRLRLEEILKTTQKYSEQMAKLSTTDKLTQVYNRSKLDDVLEQYYRRAQRYSERFSIIMIDIDHFKDVNDQHGHLVGDQILVDFADLISQKIRKTDYFGRWGGEEFMLVLPHASINTALKMAASLRQAIEKHDFKYQFSNTASFGVISFDKSMTLLELVNSADQALYLAKRSGRNCVKTLLEVADLQTQSL